MISVKLWDTEAAARGVKPIVGPETRVVSLQNGVAKDEILRREFAPAQVMGGVGYVATHIARPGVIHQAGTMQRLDIMRETVAVGRALGVALPEDFADNRLAFADTAALRHDLVDAP